MSAALSIAADLGFSSVSPSPSHEDIQSLSASFGEKRDDLIGVLRELTAVQRRVTGLQVELQGRKDRIVARLQEPYALDCIPVNEAEYQRSLKRGKRKLEKREDKLQELVHKMIEEVEDTKHRSGHMLRHDFGGKRSSISFIS